MSGEDKPRKGAIRRGVEWYVSGVARGAKGALGVESWRQASGLLRRSAELAQGSLKCEQCPRCREQSLIRVGHGFECIRDDICGYQAGSEEELAACRRQMESVDPRVLAMAKGYSGDFDRRSNGAVNVSRLYWAATLLVLCYCASWAFDGRWWYALWVFLVATWTGLQGVRFAYMARMLVSPRSIKPLDFLFSPSMWFPSKLK